MGKGRPRAIEKSIQNPCSSSSSPPPIPQAPVFYPTEDEFKDPLEFIYKIRPQAEPYGICRIVPPKSWAPPFALDAQNFTFPTKSQAIHRLQARPPSCDSKTFELEYSRFLQNHLGKKLKKRAVFEGKELDLCRVFNAVKRFGGYDKVCEGKKWGDVARLVRPNGKVSECAKHVLCQLYREHLYDYEEYHGKKCKRERDKSGHVERKGSKKRKRSGSGEESVKEETKEEFDQICEQCNSGLHGEVMLLCDRCDKGWHLYCLVPPLESIPSGNWYCLECVNSDKDSFGFVPGKKCSLDVFRRMNDRAKRKWLGQTCTTRAQIEKRFWEIVEGRGGEVEVMYGSDLDTSIYGSGFPRNGDQVPSSVQMDAWTEYCSSPWNLNNLPKLPGSMLRAVHDNIAGVMVPWLYIGMLFSSFCWHVEDHCFYSINYMHWGEPKCWYGVPGVEANAFEQVMRNTLPDLFDAQPDLLFQLVTMLNPSVLQENGVSVYNVLQEPGNFVVTFPRSFHGGFNLGLNCAEAVNFAPADWLPHGGFGAEWYRLYHKAAVLSHEELLCVVAKNDFDVKALPYLKEEMNRIYSKEKKCRVELWKNGIIRSKRMSPRKLPMYVGTEEDPTCIICQQYLYLSSVTCSCRPSVHVCLEHWKHLCECRPRKHCLVYRYTLAELGDLVPSGSLISEAITSEAQNNRNSRHHLVKEESLTVKKAKGSHICYTQLAEDWLSNSLHLFEIPFSNVAYKKALKEAEQFLWADHDMDQVRDMANRLMEAQKWAVNVGNILSKVDDSLHCGDSVKKVSLCEIEEMLVFEPLPCYEPGLAKLKAYVEDARVLSCEIESAFLSNMELQIGQMELLCSRATKFPIKIEETEKLESWISSAKVLASDATRCLAEAVDVDFLRGVKSKMEEIHVGLSDMESVLDLCREVDSWQIKCHGFLKGPIKLKDLENFLQDAANVKVTIPELELLKQYRKDACSWICNVNNVLPNLNKKEDHHEVVEELNFILEAGKSLRVQVDELPIVEAELRRFSCREKALEALSVKKPLDLLQQLLEEAALYELKYEKLFLEISKVTSSAISWEERANFLLKHAACLQEFEEVLRASEHIFVILPSLPFIEDAISVAQSWISKSHPYLNAAANSFLNIDELKGLITQSKLLKITVDGPDKLESILNDVNRWGSSACTLLEHFTSLLYMHTSDIVGNIFPIKVKELLSEVDSSIQAGLSLRLELSELPRLRHASLVLNWSLKALSFCSKIPLFKEIDILMKDLYLLPTTFMSNNLIEVLAGGSTWLKKAVLLFPGSRESKKCKLKDVEEILEQSKENALLYPMMVAHLQNAIEKHESWVEKVGVFFSQYSSQSWASLVMLNDLGQSDAFDCPESNQVAFEVEKVEKWILQCHKIVQPLVGNLDSLSSELEKVKGTLDRALCIYRDSAHSMGTFCVCCPIDSEDDAYTCLSCEDRCHFSCMGPPLVAAGTTNEYACPFCLCMESGTIAGPEGKELVCQGNRPVTESFHEVLSNARDFLEGVPEVSLVRDIIRLASECKSYLNQIVNHAVSHLDKELSFVSDRLQRALKAVAIAGVYDVQDGCNLKSALSKYSWKIRAKKLLGGLKKPAILDVQGLLKEGLDIGISSMDYFMQRTMEVEQLGMKWADTAKKVSSDLGKLELTEVFKLISEGESLPVCFEKEMKSLQDRSVLYCICRKPYDQRAMIACDQCDEWYHFDCICLHGQPPKKFFCSACKPSNGEFITLPVSVYHEERSNSDGEPHTPPACHNQPNRRHPKKARYSLQQKLESDVDLSNILKCYSELDNLWRGNKRPFRRTVRRPSKFDSLSQLIHFPQLN